MPGQCRMWSAIPRACKTTLRTAYPVLRCPEQLPAGDSADQWGDRKEASEDKKEHSGLISAKINIQDGTRKNSEGEGSGHYILKASVRIVKKI